MHRYLTAEKKSSALGSGLPRCLRELEVRSLNILSGCPFDCHYCLYQALRRSPAETSYIYETIPGQLDSELQLLKRRGEALRMVLFNTASDCFVGLERLDDLARECLGILQRYNVFTTITTKGLPSQATLELLARRPELSVLNLSISSLSDEFRQHFEPLVPPPTARLELLTRASRLKVQVRARVEPLIPMENDSEEAIQSLFRELARAGVREVVVSYLTMGKEVRQRLEQRLKRPHLNMVNHWFKNSDGVPRFGVDPTLRKRNYDRIKEWGRKLGIKVLVCACRNQDLYDGRCWSIPDLVITPQGTLL